MIGPWQVPGQGGVVGAVRREDTVKRLESILKSARNRADSGDSLRNSQGGQLDAFAISQLEILRHYCTLHTMGMQAPPSADPGDNQ